MPGFRNVGGPRFLGAGMDSDAKLLKKRSYKKTFKGYQKPTIKSWEDRNKLNRATKLNP